MQFTHLKARLQALDAPHISDATNKARVFSHDFKPLAASLKLVGVARTVNCFDDLLVILKAIQDLQKDDVLVIATNNTQRALFGELMATEIKNRGAAGIICDGGCRDIGALRNLGLPIYTRHVTPAVVTKSKMGDVQVIINCGGTPVNPGDIILGDDDGIIAIAPDDLLEALDKAESIKQREIKIIEGLNSGKSIFDFFENFDQCYENVFSNKADQLKWKDKP